jgi:hypothetical protein
MKKIKDTKSSKTLFWGLYFVFLLIYVWIRVDNISTIESINKYPDTKRYIDIAYRPINSIEFWTGEAPVAVPVIYLLFQGDFTRIAWFQTFFSIFAWSTLAFVISRQMEKEVYQFITFVILLVFSLSRVILIWDWVILSESISGSLMALLIASWFWLSKSSTWKWNRAVVVSLLGIIWIFTRDSNALIVLLSAAFPVLFVVFNKGDLRMLIISVLYIGSYWLSGLCADISGRWIGPNLNVISRRILTDQMAFDFYQENGMPDGALLLSYIGENAGPADEGFRDGDENELEDFHQWHRENGKSVYIKYLLSHPITTIAAPLYNAYALMDTRPIYYYGPEGFSPILPEKFGDFIFFRSFSPSIALISIIVFISGFAVAVWKPDKQWIVPSVLFLLIYPHGFLIWHASGGDVIRHAYQLRVHYRLTLLLFILLSVNAFLIPKSFSLFVTRWLWILRKFKTAFIIIGLLCLIISIFIDFFLPGPAEFSIGYTQGAGIILGSILFVIGLLVTLLNRSKP